MGFWSKFKKSKSIVDIGKKADEAMRRYIIKRLKELRKDSIRKMREIIMDEWYNSYTPLSYDRTEQLLESVVCHVDESNLTIKVGYDARYLKSKTVDGNWNIHRGFDGVDFRVGLIDFIENGGDGGLSPRNKDGGINAIEQTINFLQEEINKETNNIYAEAVKVFSNR